MPPKKQQKITKLVKATTKPKTDENQLQEEIKKLEQQLNEKQNAMFEIQRNRAKNTNKKKKASAPKNNNLNVQSQERSALNDKIQHMTLKMQLFSTLTGLTVSEFVEDEHCSLVFRMNCSTKHLVEHRMNIKFISYNERSFEISSMSLPPGFNLSGVLKDYGHVMQTQCIHAIRNALFAYYQRVAQYNRLHEYLIVDSEMSKKVDASYIEIPMLLQDDDLEQYQATLMLEYNLYGIRPMKFSLLISEELDIPEDAADVIRAQCFVFRSKPLKEAFHEAFIAGGGTYKLVTQAEMGPRQEKKRVPRRKRYEPYKRNDDHDDTFLTEDCTSTSSDDDTIRSEDFSSTSSDEYL